MGDGLKRAGHAARCTQPRSIYLTQEQREMLRVCLDIAGQHTALWAGQTPDSTEWKRMERVLDDLTYKLDDSNYRR